MICNDLRFSATRVCASTGGEIAEPRKFLHHKKAADAFASPACITFVICF
jgi:hypothetical protein